MTSPAGFPLGAPTINGTTLTVDVALNQPQILTRRLASITDQKFVVDRVFRTTGVSVASGALVYERTVPGDLFLKRDVELRTPGTEYPVVSGTRGEPRVARSEDWGGKFPITDEARTRNDSRLLDDEMQQLSNTLVRKINTRAVQTIEDAITAAETFVGKNWSVFETEGATPTPRRQQPAADFAAAQLLAEADELGVVFDLWLLNPVQHEALKTGYGPDLPAVLAAAGVEVFSSNRVDAGTAYAVATGQVGFLEFEAQLQVATWREESKRQTWVQAFAQPLFAVTQPRAIRKVTGLGG